MQHAPARTAAIIKRRQQRQEKLAAVHDSPKVDAKEPVHIGEGQFGESAVDGDSRVVDQRRDAAEIFLDLERELADSFRIGNVQGIGAHRG